MHAWSKQFFCMCSSKFGRLEELHEATENMGRLDEAYLNVSTGLAMIDRIMKCNIDGAAFQIKVEEIRCLDNINYMGGAGVVRR